MIMPVEGSGSPTRRLPTANEASLKSLINDEDKHSMLSNGKQELQGKHYGQEV